MLTNVGNNIDDVNMDHLTFFKIFHSLPALEDSLRFDHVVELDIKQQAILMPVTYGDENLLGLNML